MKEKENDKIKFSNIDFFSCNEKYDLILAIDVFEHIEDYYGF